MAARNNHVVVRFTLEELARVRARARGSHTPVAAYIRDACLGHAPRIKSAGSHADLIRSLNHIGIALSAHPAEDSAAALVDLRRVLRTAAKQMLPDRQAAKALNVAALE